MCGIVCAFDLKESVAVLRPQLLEMSKQIRHRGPDWSGIYDSDNAIMAHEAMGMEKIEFFWYLKKIGWLAFIGFAAGFITVVLMEAFILT